MLELIPIIIIFVYAIFLPIMRIAHIDKQHIRKSLLPMTAAFTFCLIMIQLIDMMTFKYTAGRGISGNGNPALILIFLLAPGWIYICTMVGRISHRVYLEMGNGYKIASFVIQLSLLALCTIGEIIIIQRHISILGVPRDPNAVIYRWGWFNQYTNTIFINYVVFSLSILISNLVGMLLTLKSAGGQAKEGLREEK